MARDGSGLVMMSPRISEYANDLQIWEYFLAYSTIIPRQGSATCYQITLVKNINSTHRIEGVQSQFGLSAAHAAAKAAGKADFPTNKL